MIAKARTGALATLAAGALLWASAVEFRPRITWNASPSLPRGLYLVTQKGDLRRDDLVVIPVPDRFVRLAIERGYLPPGTPLLKRVAALEGDHVCLREGVVFIKEKAVAAVLERDSKGWTLSVWKGCRRLQQGEFFALIVEAPASFDRRYLGPLKAETVIGTARPIWMRTKARQEDEPS